jgi:hypothetical protein
MVEVTLEILVFLLYFFGNLVILLQIFEYISSFLPKTNILWSFDMF